MEKSDFLQNRKGQPVFLTGLQCHNSSSGTPLIDTTIQAIQLHGGNLLEAPIYWCQIEATKDVYDMEPVRELIDQAKAAGLYLIPLWFGASKNGLFTYAPEYIKRDCAVYRRARNSAGLPVESLAPNCEKTLETACSMRAISSLAPLLIKYRGTGCVYAVTQAEFSGWQYVKTKDYHITARFLQNDPKPQHYFGSRMNTNAPENAACMAIRGRCLIIDCGEGEFYMAGAGVCLAFLRRPDIEDETPYAHLASGLSSQINFLTIEEGHFEGETWVCEYQRNGDEANYQLYVHDGQVIRIRLNPKLMWEV